MIVTLIKLFCLITTIVLMTNLFFLCLKRWKRHRYLKKISSIDLQVFLDLPNINEYIRSPIFTIMPHPYGYSPFFYKDKYGYVWYLTDNEKYLYWTLVE